MEMNKGLIKKGMYLSGIMNIAGVLVFSRLFTNKVINETDPEVMSNFGLLMIVLWGLVYFAIASKWEQMKWVIGAVVIEKFIYGFTWAKWIMNHELSRVYEQDTMAGVFYSIYGLNDSLFCIFFLMVFLHLNKAQRNS